MRFEIWLLLTATITAGIGIGVAIIMTILKENYTKLEQRVSNLEALTKG